MLILKKLNPNSQITYEYSFLIKKFKNVNYKFKVSFAHYF